MRRLKKLYPFDVKKRYKCMYLSAVFLQFCLPAYEIEFEYRCNHKKCIALKSKSVSFKMHYAQNFPFPTNFLILPSCILGYSNQSTLNILKFNRELCIENSNLLYIMRRY